MTPRSVADWLLSIEGIDGVTFSGGEPFEQARTLTRVIDHVRAERDLSVMSFSGYTLESLRAYGTPAQQAYLDRLDLLVDGPYDRTRHSDLLWRGSSNQRIHLLTQRHRDLAPQFETGQSAGLEFHIDSEANTVQWLGVPAVRNFRQSFEQGLRRTHLLQLRSQS